MTETSKDAQALVGSTIAGRYRLTGVLGRGSTGIVFEGWHEELERGIAVKVLDPEWAEPPEAVDRYLAEIGKISAIDHPHVVRIHDAGRLADGRPFVAMERLKGTSFAQLVDMDEGLPPRRVAALLEGVADALDLLHRHGHLHLDLKPENIVLAKVGDGPTAAEKAKLLDFGMAALGTSRPGDPDEERARPIPEYLAPEIAAGREPTSRADVYSLAAVAFELLTGIPPFDWASSAAWRKPVGDPEWVPTLAGRSGVPYPAELEAVIARGLAREPEDRQPTATAFVKDLAAATEKIPRPVGDEMSVAAFARASREITAKVPKIELAEDAPRVSEPERDTAVDSQPPDTIADSVSASIAESVAGATESTAAAVRRSIPPQRGDTQPLAALSSIPPRLDAPEPAAESSKPPREPKVIAGTRTSIDAAAPIPLVAVPGGKHPADPPRDLAAEAAPSPAPRSRGAVWGIALFALLLLGATYALNHDRVDRWLRAEGSSDAQTSAEPAPAEPAPEPRPEPEPAAGETHARGEANAAEPALVAAAERPPDRAGRPRERGTAPAAMGATTEPTPPDEPAAPAAEATPAVEVAPEPDRIPSVPPEESARAEMLTREGTNALVRGLLPRAIELFRDATLAAPRHAAAWRGLGLANERLGRRPEAIYAYERYLRLAPNAADSGNVRDRLDRLGGTAQR